MSSTPVNFPPQFNLINLNGTNGFSAVGLHTGDSSGQSVSSAGDINGDGIDDIVIGAPSALNKNGQSYVVFGTSRGFSSVIDLSTLDGSNGFAINGFGGSTGWSVAAAGDVNGDGVDDIIVGAPNYGTGIACIVYGSKKFSSVFDLSSLDGKNGIVIEGISSDYGSDTGGSVSSAGDINGDGFTDVIIGAHWANGGVGQAYVVFGKTNLPELMQISDLDGKNGFSINGNGETVSSGFAGGSVGSVGDINGDGFADVIIGADGINSNTGQAYIIYGHTGDFEKSISVLTLDGKNGFIINGIKGRAGYSVAGAGDFNGDGMDDFVVGAIHGEPPIYDDDYCPTFDCHSDGQAYIIYGSQNFPATFELSSLDGTNGLTFNGIDGDSVGDAVGAAGDINNDRLADVIIGDSKSSEVYLLFGSKNAQSAQIYPQDLNGVNGFTIVGGESASIGVSVNGAGDVNNDGIDDIILGSPDTLSNTGKSFIIFGINATSSVPFLPISPPTNIPMIPLEPANSTNPTSPSPGEIAGIAIGGFAALCIAGGLAYYAKAHGWCAGNSIPLAEQVDGGGYGGV